MKKMKKFLATMLAMVMVLGMTATASAADAVTTSPKGDASDRGSITITNVDASVPFGDVANGIKLYPILMADYDTATGAFSGYKPADEIGKEEADWPTNGIRNVLSEFLGKLESNDTSAMPTANEIKGLAGVKGTALAGVQFTQTDADGEGTARTATYTSSGVPAGMYLVEIPGTETKIYNPAVASVYYEENNSLAGDALDIKNATVVAKVTDHPTVDKTAKDEDGKEVNSVKAGAVITYEAAVKTVPNYSGQNPVLNIVDTLSENLELQKVKGTENWDVTVTPYIGDTAQAALVLGTGYTLDVEENGVKIETGTQKLVVNFVVNGSYTLGDYVGEKVIITYKAKLTGEGVTGNEQDNSNTVVLNYTKDSNLTGNDGKKDTNDQTHTYTFNVGGEVTGITDSDKLITKVGDKNATDEAGLPGAVFTIYKQDPNADGVTNPEIYTNEKHPVGTVTSGSDGTIKIEGLAAGKMEAGQEAVYYLKETEAPKDYTLNSHVFVIKVGASYNADGTLASWKVSVDDKDNTFKVENNNVFLDNKEENGDPKGLQTTEIQNTTMSTLPSTGGIGTTIFTIGGCAIMILAAALFFASRRKNLRK